FEDIDDASDGSMALNKMRAKKYGLVISDWNMEPMTGYDLLREVRADPNLATTDRKSTRLNSSHLGISYAVFCLKRKRTTSRPTRCLTTCAPRETAPRVTRASRLCTSSRRGHRG